MNLQITDAGQAALDANAGPVTLTLCKIGNGYNYIPSPTDTDIHGTEVFSGVPAAPVSVNANVVKYGFYMDYSVGPFAWGEFGLFMENGVLFALGCEQVLLQKLKQTSSDVGNSARLDIYLSMVNQNYEMWMDIGESNNRFRLAVVQSPDVLPSSKDATPNAYVVQSAGPTQVPMLAFTDRTGLWSFDCYAYVNQTGGTVVGFDSQSVTIALSEFNSDMSPDYFGELILEFTTGGNFSICRYVQSAIVSGGLVTLGFATPMLKTPVVGDKFIVFKRQPLSVTNVIIPIASASQLGGVKIGQGLQITTDGVLSIDPITAGFVTSINGETGDVELDANNLPGLALVAKSNNYNDLDNRPAAYTLPTASITTKGGVKMPTNGNLVTAADGTLDLGFLPVKTVNGVSADANGNVVPPPNIGLVNPQLIGASSDLNTFQTAGLFFTDATTGAIANAPGGVTSFTLEVVPFTTEGTGGDVVQRITTSTGAFIRRLTGAVWSSWAILGGQPAVATTTTIGVVQVGDGLDVQVSGILSSKILTVAGIAPTLNGNVPVTAASVGALSSENIGQPGGVAGLLTEEFGAPTDPDYYYQNARLRALQLPRGAKYAAGTWNATTNVVTVALDRWTINSLLATGNMSVTVEGPIGTFNTVTVNAEGLSFYVATAGTTSLDGNASWAVGDIIESRNGLWRKANQISVRSVQGILPGVTGDIALTRSAVSNALNGGLEGRTTAGATAPLSLYATGGNALYLNRDGGNTVYFGNGAGGTPAYVDAAGNGVFTNATALSDERKKHKLGSMAGNLHKLMQLRYFTYELRDQPGKRLVGTSAQRLQSVQPEAVMEREDGFLGVYTDGHVALLGAALQEMFQRYEVLTNDMRKLLLRIQQLEGGRNGGE